MSVDAVITWVDGDDRKHKLKRAKYLNTHIKKSENESSTRFATNYEINYCVLSILKYASWVKNIYIVTDNQTPPIFEDVSKFYPHRINDIIIIDHTQIFPKEIDILPNFNSTSIESCLWRIPGLSDRFIYFNDDFLLIQPTQINDFFIGPRPILRGSMTLPPYPKLAFLKLKKFYWSIFKINKKNRYSFEVGQYRAAKLVNSDLKFWKHDHTPYPLNKNVLKKFYLEHKESFLQNINFRFRNNSQFIINSLANNIEVKQYENHNFSKTELVYIKTISNKTKLYKKISMLKNPLYKFACIQSLDQLSSFYQQQIYKVLDQIIHPINRNE
ncbi:MAG: Stealth CR1 domain-containing protein [Flavobacteriaceae bacterium]